MTQFPSLQPEGGVFNSSPEAPHDTPSKSRVLKFSIIAVSAVILLFALAVVWEAFFSPRARSDFETRENYEQAVKGMKEFEDRMTADTYGGKTPQETLDMFIDAIEKDDIDLAVKYVYWDGGRASIDNREAMREGIVLAKNEGNLQETLELLKEMKELDNDNSNYSRWFGIKNKEGLIEYSVILRFNTHSGVWKIESM
jgi:hypothetical protein